ncbi:MAG: (d)CMP kinase [Bacteroidia bacterium]
MSKITIAIDGYSSCGKSTLAKALAVKMDYIYVDSGAMYRAVTLYLLQNEIIKKGKFEITEVLKSLNKIHLSFEYNYHNKASDTILNGVNVEHEIRTMYVSENVSKISVIKEVRDKMMHIQHDLGKNKGVVMDGRDIGTRIFPNAELKIFMTADMNVRVQRRLDEMTSKGDYATFEDVKHNLTQRDHDDTHRKESPLTQAKDAIILDNTDLNKEQQLEFVLRVINDLLLTKD